MKKIELTHEQRSKLLDLWFKYGNNGSRHTMGNHKFIQNILERGEDNRDFYSGVQNPNIPKHYLLTEECVKEVDKILNVKSNK